MGIMGELFPGKKLQNEGSGDSDGQDHHPALAIDLDAGVVRLSGPSPRPVPPRDSDDR
ncbi:hypothetical protein [Nocardia rhizosphaerihabitans]|uniref:Transposase n=1 Tax=Nocardia rhizosphaerihabitans TaxID=1691570 RepID=A0ABQ2KHN6_9NOCA|nr:hypothetical protein [Nocardia rhizosphaerihabitans]GGN79692.1 hypothetical protein GCM10011610_28310 [Nocardia rhizosphaerihabitans]